MSNILFLPLAKADAKQPIVAGTAASETPTVTVRFADPEMWNR
ncbi:hypothetical protein [Bradyrhizobium sp. NAS80.1]|nr:hypothetical protein [Bradyrhizobium sp. NAS80.1]